jgi:pyridoxine 4-dehydrogenase
MAVVKRVAIAGKEVGPIGYGLAGLTLLPSTVSDAEAIAVMKRAVELGATCWNGGKFYGSPERNSLHLCHDYFTKYPEDREKVMLSIKLGFHYATYTPDGSVANVEKEVDEALAILKGSKTLDIVELARVDPKTPIETTIGALATLQRAGKIGGIGLSEVSAVTIRRAAQVTPIASVEVEFSLFTTDILTNGVAEACAELNIPIIAYSPLGRGFLTGSLHSRDHLSARLQAFPRFSEENFPKNLRFAEELEKFAKAKGCTASQLAIAWVLKQSESDGMPVIVPIPGTTSVPRLEENMHASSLTVEDLKRIDDLIASMEVVGARYPPQLTHLNFA